MKKLSDHGYILSDEDDLKEAIKEVCGSQQDAALIDTDFMDKPKNYPCYVEFTLMNHRNPLVEGYELHFSSIMSIEDIARKIIELDRAGMELAAL